MDLRDEGLGERCELSGVGTELTYIGRHGCQLGSVLYSDYVGHHDVHSVGRGQGAQESSTKGYFRLLEVGDLTIAHVEGISESLSERPFGNLCTCRYGFVGYPSINVGKRDRSGRLGRGRGGFGRRCSRRCSWRCCGFSGVVAAVAASIASFIAASIGQSTLDNGGICPLLR